MPLPPKAELQWWYQYYFATERGRAGYDKYRHDFARLIWQLASPKWNFDDATFERSAASFDNPDHVAIVIHNYRWRLGLAEGEAKYDDAGKAARRSSRPSPCRPSRWKATPTARRTRTPAPMPRKFSGKYEHRLITGGIGHNLPQEAPQAFAQAIVDVGGFELSAAYLRWSDGRTSRRLLAAACARRAPSRSRAGSPIYGVTIPDGYRQWELIAPAVEAEPFNELRACSATTSPSRPIARDPAVSGRDAPGEARLEARPVARFRPRLHPGAATRSSHGQGFEEVRGAPAAGVLAGSSTASRSTRPAQTCFACHEARVKAHDFVFTRFAP